MAPRPPSVDALAASLDDGRLPRPVLIRIARDAVAAFRESGADPTEHARSAVESAARSASAGSVINATGVLLHTNLGRAPLHPRAAAAAAAAATGYSALEFDLATGRRGARGARAAELITTLTGSEAALTVNNNAGALLLTVAALAGGRKVVVSRGEQIEIGGSFRLPDVVTAARAEAIEIGTTNKTRVADYEKALEDPAVALVLKIHPSNYRIDGFTGEVSYREVATLARAAGRPMAADIGSGLLDTRVPWLSGAPPPWLQDEPGARQTIDAGADLVLFSGDKLLGGPQAGIVAGRTELVERLAAHPLARAVRIGGPPLAALTETLALYAEGRGGEIPLWAMAALPAAALRSRCEAVVERAGTGSIVEGAAVVGGGSVPGTRIPGPAIRVEGDADAIRKRLLEASPPVVARVADDGLVVDLRSVEPAFDDHIAESLQAACRS